MIKTLTNLFKQDKEKFVVPKGVQDVFPLPPFMMMVSFRWARTSFPRPLSFRI